MCLCQNFLWTLRVRPIRIFQTKFAWKCPTKQNQQQQLALALFLSTATPRARVPSINPSLKYFGLAEQHDRKHLRQHQIESLYYTKRCTHYDREHHIYTTTIYSKPVDEEVEADVVHERNRLWSDLGLFQFNCLQKLFFPPSEMKNLTPVLSYVAHGLFQVAPNAASVFFCWGMPVRQKEDRGNSDSRISSFLPSFQVYTQQLRVHRAAFSNLMCVMSRV